MKKRLFKSFSWTILVIIILTSVATTVVFYRSHKAAHEKRLKQIANFFADIPENSEEIYNKARKNFSGMRITLIDKDGNVEFETDEDKGLMEAHNTREEFIQAKKRGYGEAIRKSETLGEQYYYYAVLLDNGDIIRVAELQANIYKSFLNIFAPLVMILFLAYVVSFVIVNRVATNIVNNLKLQIAGIKEGNYNDEIFTELYPIKRIIDDQSDEIRNRLDNLNEYKNTMNQILINMTEGFIFIDDVNRVEMLNKKAIELLGKDTNEIYEKKSIFYLLRDEEFMNIFAEKNSYKKFNLNIDVGDNKIRLDISPVTNRGEYLGRIIIMRDITEENMLETERKEFTSNITHDLRTPLTTINGYAELLSKSKVKEDDVNKIGGVILREGNRILSMIDSVIELSKLEEKRSQKKEDINVKETVNKILESFELKIMEKNIHLNTQLEEVRYKGVDEVLSTVIYNLMDNAIKYGKRDGNIKIELMDSGYYFIFKIEDDGIGISEKDQEKVFRRFYVADESRHRSDSNGLGLAIVKHGVEAMNGQISLESKLGQGSSFTVEIPY